MCDSYKLGSPNRDLPASIYSLCRLQSQCDAACLVANDFLQAIVLSNDHCAAFDGTYRVVSVIYTKNSQAMKKVCAPKC